MKIVFATTQALSGSTVVGRILPICEQLAKQHEVHLLLLNSSSHSAKLSQQKNIYFHYVGNEPFTRTSQGKKRLRGLPLIIRLFSISLQTFFSLQRINPDTVVIVKPLPHNTLGVKFWSLFNRRKKIILDVDDFELTANVLSSMWQRTTIHWSRRTAANLANTVVAATHFLADQYLQLTNNKKEVVLIPTGLTYHQPINQAHPKNTPTLLYIGSVSISSGHRVDLLPNILFAVKQSIPNIKLIMAGSGDDISKLKKLFEQRDLTKHVQFTGRFSSSDIPNLLAKTSVIIDPIDNSISNRAKSSFRTLLGVAASIPIVTSNIGIRALIVPTKFHSRFFAKPNNSTDYTQKIISLTQNPLLKEEQQTLQKHSQQFSWERLATKYLNVILS